MRLCPAFLPPPSLLLEEKVPCAARRMRWKIRDFRRRDLWCSDRLIHCDAIPSLRRCRPAAQSDNPAGRSLRGCLRVSAVDCIRGGPCPLGLPCGSVTPRPCRSRAADSDNPAGRSLRGCLRVSAVDCIRGGPCPLGLPCGSVTPRLCRSRAADSDTPAGRSLRGCLRVSAIDCIRGGPCPLGLPCGSVTPRLCRSRTADSDNPACRSLRGCLSMTPQMRQSVFVRLDAGELRLGQITPTALPSSRQTAS